MTPQTIPHKSFHADHSVQTIWPYGPSPWPSGIDSRLGRNRLGVRFLAVSDIYPMFIKPTITWVPSGFSGYIWLDSKIVLKIWRWPTTWTYHAAMFTHQNAIPEPVTDSSDFIPSWDGRHVEYDAEDPDYDLGHPQSVRLSMAIRNLWWLVVHRARLWCKHLLYDLSINQHNFWKKTNSELNSKYFCPTLNYILINKTNFVWSSYH